MRVIHSEIQIGTKKLKYDKNKYKIRIQNKLSYNKNIIF